PFRVVQPVETLIESPPEDGPCCSRSSWKRSLADHRNFIEDEALRAAFGQASRCFLDEADARSDWLFQNVEQSHVAIHYKGEHILRLLANRTRFYVGSILD